MTNLCQHCKKPFEAVKSTARYCSGRCRAEDSRKRREREVANALRDIGGAVSRIRRAMGGEQDGE